MGVVPDHLRCGAGHESDLQVGHAW